MSASMEWLNQASVHYRCLCHTAVVMANKTCLYVCVDLMPINVLSRSGACRQGWQVASMAKRAYDMQSMPKCI
jgi:hypothetical protein